MISDAILSFAKPYELERGAPGTFVDGRYVEGAATVVTIRASVQPTKGRDLLLLEEGARVRGSVTVFTPDPISVGEAPDGASADVIRYNGARYRVSSVEDWTDAGGYYKAIASKILGA